MHKFRVDKIKIDRSFVQALDRDNDCGAIVMAIVAMGHAMGLDVAAEGVETAAQKTFLDIAGCKELQGLISREHCRKPSSQSCSANAACPRWLEASPVRIAAIGLAAGVALAPMTAAAADVSGQVGAVNVYRDRGLDLSRGRPAVQGDVTMAAGNGAYANVWASTLGNAADVEVDLSVGWKGALSEAVGLDLYATYVAYPSDRDASYAELTATVGLTRGPAILRGGASLAPPQRGTRDEAGARRTNLYGFVQAEYALARTPLTLSATMGHERGPFDAVADGGKWDWSLGALVERAPFVIGLRYSGSNADSDGGDALTASLFLGW